MDFGEAVAAPGLMRRLERWWAHQPKPAAAEAVEVEAETERHLRALGYVDGEP
jgi:hypothetical protein